MLKYRSHCAKFTNIETYTTRYKSQSETGVIVVALFS